MDKRLLSLINKRKALHYLYLEAPIATAADNKELLSFAKVVRFFKNIQYFIENNCRGYDF